MAKVGTINPVDYIKGKLGGTDSGFFMCGMESNFIARVRKTISRTNRRVKNGIRQPLPMHTSNSVLLNQTTLKLPK